MEFISFWESTPEQCSAFYDASRLISFVRSLGDLCVDYGKSIDDCLEIALMELLSLGKAEHDENCAQLKHLADFAAGLSVEVGPSKSSAIGTQFDPSAPEQSQNHVGVDRATALRFILMVWLDSERQPTASSVSGFGGSHWPVDLISRAAERAAKLAESTVSGTTGSVNQHLLVNALLPVVCVSVTCPVAAVVFEAWLEATEQCGQASAAATLATNDTVDGSSASHQLLNPVTPAVSQLEQFLAVASATASSSVLTQLLRLDRGTAVDRPLGQIPFNQLARLTVAVAPDFGHVFAQLVAAGWSSAGAAAVSGLAATKQPDVLERLTNGGDQVAVAAALWRQGGPRSLAVAAPCAGPLTAVLLAAAAGPADSPPVCDALDVIVSELEAYVLWKDGMSLTAPPSDAADGAEQTVGGVAVAAHAAHAFFEAIENDGLEFSGIVDGSGGGDDDDDDSPSILPTFGLMGPETTTRNACSAVFDVIVEQCVELMGNGPVHARRLAARLLSCLLSWGQGARWPMAVARCLTFYDTVVSPKFGCRGEDGSSSFSSSFLGSRGQAGSLPPNEPTLAALLHSCLLAISPSAMSEFADWLVSRWLEAAQIVAARRDYSEENENPVNPDNAQASLSGHITLFVSVWRGAVRLALNAPSTGCSAMPVSVLERLARLPVPMSAAAASESTVAGRSASEAPFVAILPRAIDLMLAEMTTDSVLAGSGGWLTQLPSSIIGRLCTACTESTILLARIPGEPGGTSGSDQQRSSRETLTGSSDASDVGRMIRSLGVFSSLCLSLLSPNDVGLVFDRALLPLCSDWSNESALSNALLSTTGSLSGERLESTPCAAPNQPIWRPDSALVKYLQVTVLRPAKTRSKGGVRRRGCGRRRRKLELAGSLERALSMAPRTLSATPSVGGSTSLVPASVSLKASASSSECVGRLVVERPALLSLVDLTSADSHLSPVVPGGDDVGDRSIVTGHVDNDGEYSSDWSASDDEEQNGDRHVRNTLGTGPLHASGWKNVTVNGSSGDSVRPNAPSGSGEPTTATKSSPAGLRFCKYLLAAADYLVSLWRADIRRSLSREDLVNVRFAGLVRSAALAGLLETPVVWLCADVASALVRSHELHETGHGSSEGVSSIRTTELIDSDILELFQLVRQSLAACSARYSAAAKRSSRPEKRSGEWLQSSQSVPNHGGDDQRPGLQDGSDHAFAANLSVRLQAVLHRNLDVCAPLYGKFVQLSTMFN